MKRMTNEEARRLLDVQDAICRLDKEELKLVGRFVELLKAASDDAVKELTEKADREWRDMDLRPRLDAAIALLEGSE